jgi:hypothetical protein
LPSLDVHPNLSTLELTAVPYLQGLLNKDAKLVKDVKAKYGDMLLEQLVALLDGPEVGGSRVLHYVCCMLPASACYYSDEKTQRHTCYEISLRSLKIYMALLATCDL